MTTERLLRLLLTVLIMMLIRPAGSHAQYDYIDISNPFLRKIPMAIPEFVGLDDNYPAESATLTGATEFLTNALLFTGYFQLIDRGAYLLSPGEKALSMDEINFTNWKSIGAETLITGGLSQKGDLVDIELRMFDTLSAKRQIGKRYHGKVSDLRSMILRFCSEVIFQLTGNKGIYDSRIAFVSTGSGSKEIYICEFDGTDPIRFTRHESISMSPAWSSDGNWLAYTSYVKNKPDIYIRKLDGSRQEVVDKKGINIGPAWVPGQFKFAATLSFSGNQEIYLLTGNGKVIKTLTRNWASDLSPTWSPDGGRMAFVSNRSGSPQIYIQDMPTGRVERLTFEGSYNTQPSWSPTGDRVAFSSLENGAINIYVIDVNRRETIQLTRDSGENESPSWSPDGSLLVFSSTREGPSRLYVMTAYGTDQRRLLTLSGEQSHPSWSTNVRNN